MERQEHKFEPVYDENSEILILGSFPSVKSREQNFYYGYKQNRFWKVIASITNSEIPETIDDKKSMLLDNNIAIWDVIKSCTIKGSSDSSIRDVVPNDIENLISKSSIKRVYANGEKSYNLYKKYCEKNTGIEAIKLPSTSPANASFSLEKLVDVWKENILKDYE